MTAFDRLEVRIPELMDELAPARVPDYFDDMLRQSARTGQRPAWSSLEWWLPMGVLARTDTIRQVPWRPIVAVSLLIVAIAAAVAIYAGSRPHRVPPPFGPAGNGLALFTQNGGDIAALDPISLQVRVLIGGPEHDWGPVVSPDGLQFVFARTTDTQEATWVANIDGSGAREILATGSATDRLESAPDSNRLLVVPATTHEPIVIDVAAGTSTALSAGTPANMASWRPGHDQLVVTTDSGNGSTFSLTGLDGTVVKALTTTPDFSNGPALSPDGTRLAYSPWPDDPAQRGIIHVDPIDGGAEITIAPNPPGSANDISPRFSPDGSLILAAAYSTQLGSSSQARLVLLRSDGQGAPIELGAMHGAGPDGIDAQFSPDGTEVLATYPDDGMTWLFPIDGSPGRLVGKPGRQFDWQRTGW
jgi:Tol biopolymer transport system component